MLSTLDSFADCVPVRRVLFFLCLCLFAAPASAEVQIHFYSKDLANSFPHAFIRLTGTVEATGQPVDANYGFTPLRVSPAILAGAVKGKIVGATPKYIARSNRHFSLTLTDEEFARVLQYVESWRAMPQPAYRLNSRNCIHFVAGIATMLGLNAQPVPKLMKKPKSFLQHITRANQQIFASWAERRRTPVLSQQPVALPRR